ncbi:MAG: hypothetical protein COA78_35630 [Blastopirellula sp.]|nr:MAG: hypothetical protein COA78_35630 [Blastopirellula sp.]
MRRIIFGAIASVLLLAGTANAGILVGTVVKSQTETIAEMNALIHNYNTVFSADLPDIGVFLDKIEDTKDQNDISTGSQFINNQFLFTDFNFYVESGNTGTKSVDIFNTEVHFNASTLALGIGFDTVAKNVQGFEQNSGPTFEYYVSKDGKKGWSLWTYMDGFNPFYTDLGIIDNNNNPSKSLYLSSLTTVDGGLDLLPADDSVTGFTRGPITDGSLAYDPIVNSVSHLSFYTAELPDDPDTVIPEPATMAIWGMLTGFGALFGYRKRKLATVTA